MYLSHYGLDEPPFRITPVTDFFYGGANRAAILEALIYAITHGEGMIKVVGEVGSGKTTMCRVLMERLPENIDTVYLADPTLSREEILYAIADELGIDLAGQRATVGLRALQKNLIERFAAGRRVVLLIDEAHAMPLQTLEEVRLLSNLETSRDKLLQIVLFGQPELDENLGLPRMRQLKDRIIHHFEMEPLAEPSIGDYLAFRMRAAGYRGPNVFSAAAVRLISRASQGLTRRVNILADKALLAAFVANTHGVEARHVKKAIRDSQFDLPPRRRAFIRSVAAAIGVALIGLGALWILSGGIAPPRTPAPVPQSPAPVAQAPATGPETVELRAAPAPQAPQAVPAPEAPGASSAPQAAVPAAPAIPAGADTPTPTRTTAPSGAGEAQSPPQPAPAAAGAASVDESVAATSPAKPAAERPLPPEPPAAAIGNGKLLRSRVEATRKMLASTSGDRFTVHLFVTNDGTPERIEDFLGRAEKSVDLSAIYVFASRGAGKNRYRVAYGIYPTRDEAAAAMAGLPEKYHKGFRLQLTTLEELRRAG